MDAKIIPDTAHDVFHYDPDTGDLTWKETKYKRKAGAIAGTLNANGYRHVRLEGSTFKAHRVAYFMHHGVQPETIDHINRDRADNRIVNLRSVTTSQNNLNNGKSGVAWQKWKHHRYAFASYKRKCLYFGTNVMVAHYRRIMAERQDHPIGLPAPV